MIRFRSANPVYKRMLRGDAEYVDSYEQATYQGVAGKSVFYIFLVLIGAAFGIYTLLTNPTLLMPVLVGAGIGGFILALVAFISPRATKIAGSLYCVLQGVVVGTISYLFESFYQGIVLSALLATVVVVLVVATLFISGVVKVTAKFTRFLLIFAISFIVMSILLWILNLTGVIQVTYGMAIGISAISIFLATLYLFFDMEMIRQVVEGGQPKDMEWFVAFGLVFTIIWLYLEILRLIALIMSRD